MKILEVTADERTRTLTLQLAGLAGNTYELELLTKLPQIQSQAASAIHKTVTGFKLDVTFEGASGFVKKSVTVKY